MSAAAVLPCVWAAVEGPPLPTLVLPPPQFAPRPSAPPLPSLAFYRKYTIALLHRFLRRSLQAGRVPSLLGQEMFRAKITHCRSESLEDIVIFLHDVERCLEKLTPEQQHLIARVTLQEFTVGEVAVALGTDPRTIIRRHARALDALTRILLDVKIFHPPDSCQGGKS
jgi:Sigma-70, region 4